MHWSSVLIAGAVGLWVAANEPATIVFERGMRALGLTGPILVPTSLLFSVAATLLALLVAYGIAYGTLRVVVERMG
jgi:hypothetical protein